MKWLWSCSLRLPLVHPAEGPYCSKNKMSSAWLTVIRGRGSPFFFFKYPSYLYSQLPGFGPAAEVLPDSSRRVTPLLFREKTSTADALFETQHSNFGSGVALRVPCAVRRLRRRANSLGSNTARLFSGIGCTARQHHRPAKTTETKRTLT